eukprot:g897.t1
MASSKMNEVTRNQIWSDVIENENRVYEKKFKIKEYVVPRSLKTSIPLKPNQVDPKKFMDAVRRKDKELKAAAAAASEKMSEDSSSTKKDDVVAKDTDFQYTAISQAYGTDWEIGMKSRKKFERWLTPLGTCEETRYASSFHAMTGKSPFAKK